MSKIASSLTAATSCAENDFEKSCWPHASNGLRREPRILQALCQSGNFFSAIALVSLLNPENPGQHLLRRPSDHVPAQADLDDVPELQDLGLAEIRRRPAKPPGHD